MDEQKQEGAPTGTSEAAVMQGPDQSYKKFIGVKLIEAYPCKRWNQEKNQDDEGYAVRYPDGYESWSPKEVFESAYLSLGTDETRITPAVIDSIIAEITVTKIDPKTALVKSEQVTGFTQYATAACVVPENYDEEIGKKIAMTEIRDRLWYAMGFVLQWARYGLKNTPKQ
jgi:hypothetical protein